MNMKGAGQSPASPCCGLSALRVKTPYSLHIPSCSHTRPTVEMFKRTREAGKETIWLRRNGLYWFLSWPEPMQEEVWEVQSWSLHRNVWQMTEGKMASVDRPHGGFTLGGRALNSTWAAFYTLTKAVVRVASMGPVVMTEERDHFLPSVSFDFSCSN